MASILRQVVVLAVLGGGAALVIDRQLDVPAQEQSAARARPAPGVVTEAAREDRVERAVSAVGSGRALRSVELRVSEDGRVTERLFEQGDAVAAGAALLRLDEAQERAALAEAEAALAEAEAAFERARALREQGRATGAAFETAQSELRRTEARHDRARTDLERRTLRAPFDGVIGFTEIDVGAMVGPSDTIATIDDLSAIEADFSIPERFFDEVKVGAEVRATSSAFPGDAFAGRVAAIDRRVDEASRAFRVRARFGNPGMRLPAGLFMRVELVLDSRLGVLAPEEALVPEGGSQFIYVVGPDERVERREVTVGARAIGEVEVLSGLAPGEAVVVRGVQKVRDGAPVRLLEGSAPPAARPQAQEGGIAAPGAAAAPASAGPVAARDARRDAI